MTATTITQSAGSATQVRDQIEYVTTGIRRKIIAKGNSQQAVLLCLSAGSMLHRHASSRDGLITVFEGQGIFILDGQKIGVDSGSLITLPAHTAHSVIAITNLAFIKVVASQNECQDYPFPRNDGCF